MSSPVNHLTEQPNATRFEHWPAAASLQPNPPVFASFEGLLALCYNPGGWCEVGFHQADGRHRLEVEVSENSTPLILHIPQPIRTMRLSIVIAEQEQRPRVEYLKDGSDNDFRWVLDLENPEFYPEPYGVDPKFEFRALLRVSHGTFFTALRNLWRLSRVSRTFPVDWPLDLPVNWPMGTPFKPGWNPYDLSWPARVIGLNINLAASEKVRLFVNDQIVATIPIDAAKRYSIRFSNECREGNHECEFAPGDWHEAKRNDFYFHRDVLSLPALKTRYGVILNPDKIRNPGRATVLDPKMVISDSAPCMGSGFGKSGGF